EILRRAAAAGGRVAYVDTHAGEGRYALGPTGEWTEGIGRLWDAARATTWNDTVARYVALCRRLGAGGERPHRYPGSPALARAVLAAEAELLLFERATAAFASSAATASPRSARRCAPPSGRLARSSPSSTRRTRRRPTGRSSPLPSSTPSGGPPARAWSSGIR